MKYLLITVSALIITSSAFSKINDTKPDGTEVLKKVMSKLNSLKAISYTYKKILDYPGEGYHDEAVVDTYLDFDPTAQFIGVKYQFSNNDFLFVYNGSEVFDCNKKEKTIAVNNSPDLSTFQPSSFLFNSPVTLKNVLPSIIADPSIPKILSDTTINNKSFYVVDIILQNKTLNSLGDYVATTMKLNFSYKVIIEKKTFMPVEVLERTLNNKDTNITFFTDINFNPVVKAENSWFSSNYTDYAIEKPKEKVELIKVGAPAPDSHLTFFVSQKTTSVSDFKGNVILLEFWIKDCGHCIERIPDLNAISTRYKDKSFKLLAINASDTKKMIKVFISKHNIKYDLLTGGKDVERDYGISGFPMVVLINKEGSVIFSGGFNEQKLKTLIDQNI